MARRIEKPSEIYEAFTNDCKAVFGTKLESVIVHGSAARGDYRADSSDINFLLVVKEDGLDRLHGAFDFVKSWRRRGVSTPLVLTGEYLRGALDSFPIEFLNMRASYEVLLGRDALQGLEIDREPVRVQAEKEARADLLRLRRLYLESGGKGRALRDIVRASMPSYFATFRAIAWLITGRSDQTRAETVSIACERFGLDRAVFTELDKIWRGAKPDGKTMRALFERYLREARRLVLAIDQLDSIFEEDTE
ncbi:MAG: nucleotidyltransferase domain-containing protein [Gemmatimonadetes bacterium]|nr:nucleotidyltransferase domain-containing protein [Gemmatimonadota bacterium]